jgi:hypothetical protein
MPMSDRVPADAFDPREYVRDELTARGIDEANMPPVLRRWLDGDTALSLGVAQTLYAWIGGHWEFYLRLDAAWQRWKETRDD